LGVIFAERQALDLVAVTTIGRHGAARARVAASLLGLAGRNDVETCIGAEAPLLRNPAHFNWFEHEERCIADAPSAPISDEPAAERIVRAAREQPGLELVAIGPMTNLARAFALDPELPSRLGGVTIMGGHIREARIGSFLCAPGIDYNLCADPEATLTVLGAGFATTLVSADVTLRVWLRDADVDAMRKGSALQRELARQVDIWKPVQHRIFSALGGDLAPDNAAFLHDPLTLLALVDTSDITFEQLYIVSTLERGVLRTIEVPAGSGLGARMRVATKVEPKRAAAAVAERLRGL
jgi:purine nucleosidase